MALSLSLPYHSLFSAGPSRGSGERFPLDLFRIGQMAGAPPTSVFQLQREKANLFALGFRWDSSHRKDPLNLCSLRMLIVSFP